MKNESKEKNINNEAETKVEDVNALLPVGEPIEKPQEDATPYQETIENARLEFNKAYKKSRMVSYIMMGIVLLGAVAGVVLISMKGQVWHIVGWSIIGVDVLGMILFYIISRSGMPNRTKEYIKTVNKELNIRNFSDGHFQEVYTDPKEKLELSDCISDSIYKDINNIASRNVINGKYDGRTFKVGDLGLYSGGGRSRRSLFVGKYMSYPNDIHFQDRYIINIKGSQPVDLPDFIDDLKTLYQEGDITIYGKEGNNPTSDLGKEFLKKIKGIEVKEKLLNLNLVIWGGHSAAYASYDDDIMSLPFDKEFKDDANEQYRRNLMDIMAAFNLLVKEEK